MKKIIRLIPLAITALVLSSCGIFRDTGGSGGDDPKPSETPVLKSISVNTENAKKVFTINETFSYSGLVVKANLQTSYSSTVEDVTSDAVVTPESNWNKSEGQKTVNVSYTRDNVTKSSSYKVTVNDDSSVTKYTVSFNANGGTGSMESCEIPEGTFTLPSCTFVAPSEKTFDGWKVNNTGNTYDAGDSYNLQSDITLYAQWREQAVTKCTVSFNANGGSGTMSPVSRDPGTYPLPNCTFTAPSGKTFEGWKVNNSGETLSTNYSYNLSSDITLYAQWKNIPTPTPGDIPSEFELLSNESDFEVGRYVVFSSGNSGTVNVMSTTQNTNNRPATSVSISDNKITDPASSVAIFRIDEGTKANTFSFYDTNSKQYIYAASSSANYLRSEETKSDNSSFTYSYSDGEITLTAQGSNTRNIIRYNPNNSNPIFSCYASNSTAGNLPYLFISSGEEIYPESITVAGISPIGIGEDANFTVSFNPTNTNKKTVSWESSNSSIATVSSTGAVHGVAAGDCIITAKALKEDNTYATDSYNLHVQSYPVTGVTLDKDVASVSIGNTVKLNATVAPNNATDKVVSWSSSNTSKATVDDNGVVTGVATGSATITVTTHDGGFTDTCNVTVTAAPAVSKTHLDYDYDDYQANNFYTVDNCPLTGSPKLLIIPIWFSDSSTFINTSAKENIRSDIQKAYLGTNTETGWRSVKTFYEEESAGELTLTGTVTDWYSVNSSYTTYGADQSKTTSLVTTATTWYFSNNSSDSKSNYDTNHDGYLDGVLLIYAAPDYSALDNENYGNLWAYCFWLQEAKGTASNPKPNVFFWASYDFMYDSSTSSSRTGGKSNYASGDCSHCTIDAHTFIHEMGHVLGAEDYYDYSQQYNPAGGFSMQDYNVGGHDPYTVMAYGWADPYIPTTSMSITINDFQSSHDLILLANHSVDSPFDEYLLLELYTPTGLNKMDSDYKYDSCPKGPTTPGIRVWHIDARLAYGYQSGEDWYVDPDHMTTDPTHGEVMHAMSNTYYNASDEELEDYYSPFGDGYYDYNILQLIRNNTTYTYQPTNNLSASDLFVQGNSFSMNTYKKQFVGSTNMNNGTALGWSFTVTSLSSSSATIQLTKA